jgi:hypothetical protein
VPNDHPFAREITYVADVGIANGYADGSFQPDAQITRQAVAAWMCRASAISPYGGFEVATAPTAP